MRAALDGDAQSYRQFLNAATPHLRGLVRRRCLPLGLVADADDIVQEVLLAIHLKRETWDPERLIGPWIAAIVRYKLIDALRRRGHVIKVALEDVIDSLAVAPPIENVPDHDVLKLLDSLGSKQRSVVEQISLQGASVRETASRLAMTEGSVRVTLHRALKALAAAYRNG
jgi:RNA polymerase sigma-70 factor (ECF subfamily)